MAEEKDSFDAMIEDIAGKGEDAPEGGAPEGAAAEGTPAAEKEPATPAGEAAAAKPNSDPDKPAAIVQTPEEVWGEEYKGKTWDDVKVRVGEAKTLREELDLAKKQPKVAFANDTVASFNAFVAKTGVENFSVYQKLLTVDQNDPIAVLTAKFILDNPEYAGKEELLSKKFTLDYKTDPATNTPEEVEINTISLQKAAKDAIKSITELRDSLKIAVVTETVEDVAAREGEWKERLSQDLSDMTELPIPVIDPKTKEVVKYATIPIPPEYVKEYMERMTPVYTKQGKVSEVEKKQIRADLVKDYLYNNFHRISSTIRLQAETAKEAELDAKYNGAGKLKDEEVAPTGSEEVDTYKEIWKD